MLCAFSSTNYFFQRHMQLKSLFMACDPSEDSDISSLSCLGQCFRVDSGKSSFLAFCELWFVYDFSWWHSLSLRAEPVCASCKELLAHLQWEEDSVQLVGILFQGV